MGLLTANVDANLLDPKSWTKLPEPVLARSPENSRYEPGHNSFTSTPDGETDIIVYHTRNYKKIQGHPLFNPDRATRAQAIRWRLDGMPHFGVPVSNGLVNSR
jgi:GH43 family beta-xylosidase